MGEGLFGALMQGDGSQSSQYTSKLTLNPPVDAALTALQLTDALRGVLEAQRSEDEQDSLRKQVSSDTAEFILKWLQQGKVTTHLNASTTHTNTRIHVREPK